jgi:hypothetical protein
VAADAFVRADLAVLAGEPEPMPDEVVARLGNALAAEPPLPGPAPGSSRPHLSVLSGGRATPSPARRRRRAVLGVAAAAVVLGLGAVSLASQFKGGSARSSTTAATDSARRAQPPSPATAGTASAAGAASAAGTASAASATDVRASGSDYDAQTLAALGAASITGGSGDTTSKAESRPNILEAPPQPTVTPTAVPDPLRRLTEPAARAACLKAVVAQYGGTATLLDYARYQSSPALVVVLDDAGGVRGRKRVVVVGPACGTGSGNTDQRYSAPVG